MSVWVWEIVRIVTAIFAVGYLIGVLMFGFSYGFTSWGGFFVGITSLVAAVVPRNRSRSVSIFLLCAALFPAGTLFALFIENYFAPDRTEGYPAIPDIVFSMCLIAISVELALRLKSSR